MTSLPSTVASTRSPSADRIVPKSWSPPTRRTSSWVASTSRPPTGSANRTSRRSSKWPARPSGGGSLPWLIGGEPDFEQWPAGALAVGQVVAVDGDLGLLGAEADAQAMPARLSHQPLDRQRGAAGRLDRQALLGPAQDRPDGLGAVRVSEQEVGEPLLAGRDRAGVVESDLQPTRADRLGEAAGQRGHPRPESGGCAPWRAGARRRSRGRRPGPSGDGRSPRNRRRRPGPRPAAGRPRGPPAGPGRSSRPPSSRGAAPRPRRPIRGVPRSAGRGPARAGTGDRPSSDRGRALRTPRPTPVPTGSEPRPRPHRTGTQTEGRR